MTSATNESAFFFVFLLPRHNPDNYTTIVMKLRLIFREPVLFWTVRLIEAVQKADSLVADVIKQ